MAIPSGITANPDGTYTDQSGNPVFYTPPQLSSGDENGYGGGEIQVPERWTKQGAVNGYDYDKGAATYAYTPYLAPEQQAQKDMYGGAMNPQDASFFPQLQNIIQQTVGGQYSQDQILAAMMASNWWGKLGGGSNAYNAAKEVADRLGANTDWYNQGTSEQYRQYAESQSHEGRARATPHGGLFGEGGWLGFGNAALPIQVALAAASMGASEAASTGASEAAGSAATPTSVDGYNNWDYAKNATDINNLDNNLTAQVGTDGANAQAWQGQQGFDPNSTAGDPLYGGQGGGVGAESGVGTGPYGNVGFGKGTLSSSTFSTILSGLKEYAPAIAAGTGLLGAVTGLTGAGVGLYSALKGQGSLSNGGVGNIKGNLSGANGLMTPGGAAAMADPNLPYRPGYASALNSIVQNPFSLMGDPGYQFAFNQGIQAIDRAAAAKGQLESGNRGEALFKFGHDYAGNYYGDAIKTLSGISGANYSPATAAQEALAAQNQGVGVAQTGVTNTNNAYSALSQGLGGFGTSLGALGTGIGRAVQSLTPSAPVTSNSSDMSWTDTLARLFSNQPNPASSRYVPSAMNDGSIYGYTAQ